MTQKIEDGTIKVVWVDSPDKIHSKMFKGEDEASAFAKEKKDALVFKLLEHREVEVDSIATNYHPLFSRNSTFPSASSKVMRNLSKTSALPKSSGASSVSDQAILAGNDCSPIVI